MWWGLTGWPPWSSQWVWMNPRYPLDLGEVCSTPSCVCMCEGQVGDTAWSSLCSLLGAMPTQGGQHAYTPTRQAFSPGTMALSAATTPCREPPPTPPHPTHPPAQCRSSCRILPGLHLLMVPFVLRLLLHFPSRLSSAEMGSPGGPSWVSVLGIPSGRAGKSPLQSHVLPASRESEATRHLMTPVGVDPVVSLWAGGCKECLEPGQHGKPDGWTDR